MRANEAARHYKDPSFLTPLEERVYELHQSGADYDAIAASLNIKISTVKNKISEAREKIILKEIFDAQDRRISWP